MVLYIAVAVAAAGSAHGQSASQILQHMLDAHVQRAERVDNYTLIQEVMGFDSEMYFEKETVDGLPMFHLRQTKVGGRTISQPDADDAGWERMYQLLPELMERADYAGRGDVHSFPVHVIEVRDLHEVDFAPIPDSEGSEFVPETMTLHVDADQWIVRRAELSGSMTANGQQHDFTADVEMTDYREIEGMLHPYVVTVKVSGLADAMGMSEEDMAELREQLEEMKQQMEQMPEAQRKMVEQMMSQRMAGLEQMLGNSGDGAMTIEMRVKELLVNSGRP
jgi:hypothetical protein